MKIIIHVLIIQTNYVVYIEFHFIAVTITIYQNRLDFLNTYKHEINDIQGVEKKSV